MSDTETRIWLEVVKSAFDSLRLNTKDIGSNHTSVVNNGHMIGNYVVAIADQVICAYRQKEKQ